MKAVTFDSNVWRLVASPSRFANDPRINVCVALNAAIKSGRLRGYIPETVFTIEQIRRGDRKGFLGHYRGRSQIHEREVGDAVATVISIGPTPDAHGGNPTVLAKHFEDALMIGMRVLRTPRIAGVVNPDLNESHFVHDAGPAAIERNERFGACLAAIEERGAGIAQIKAIGQKYAGEGHHWLQGIGRIPPDEEPTLVKAVAEWADGDAVAAHYGYRNDLFCTNDVGISGGARSVLHPTNRAWLRADLGIIFATPEDVAKGLTL